MQRKNVSQRLAESFSKIMAWAKKDKANMILLVVSSLAILVFLIILLHFFLPAILLIVAAIIYAVYSIANRNAIQANQVQEYWDNVETSIVYSLRHAIDGQQNIYGLPTTPDSGFTNVVPHSCNGVKAFTAVYLHSPAYNVATFTPKYRDALRQLLNNRLAWVSNNIIYNNVMYVPFYVYEVLSANNQLAIKVIPITDSQSLAVVKQHQALITQSIATGSTPNAVPVGGNVTPSASPTPISIAPPASASANVNTPANPAPPVSAAMNVPISPPPVNTTMNASANPALPVSATMNAPTSPPPANATMNAPASPAPVNATPSDTPAPVDDGDLVDDEI